MFKGEGVQENKLNGKEGGEERSYDSREISAV